MKILGTPLGSDASVARDVRGTIAKRARIVGRHSQRFRPAMRVAGSVQVCRTSLSPPLQSLPPDQSHEYATRHHEEMREVMASLLHGLPGDSAQQNMVQCTASLPIRRGGVQNIVAHQNTASVSISFTITFPTTTNMKFGLTLQHVVSTR